MSREAFHGYALNVIDAKNRLSIPASYRDVVEARSSARAIVVAPHEREPCLVGYDRARSSRLQELIDRRFGDEFGAERDDYARLAFGTSEVLPYDDNGRVILSATLKELGEIDRLAFFLGAGDYFEIWNPTVLREAKPDPRLVRIVDKQLETRR